MRTECTLSDDELIERCEEWVSKLARSGGREWTLQVPVNFNRDPDMLFCELINRYKKKQEKSMAETVKISLEEKKQILVEEKHNTKHACTR